MTNPLKAIYKQHEKACVKKINTKIKQIQDLLIEDQVLHIKTHSENGKKVLKIEWDEFESNVQESPEDLLGLTPMSPTCKSEIKSIEQEINKFMVKAYIGFDNTISSLLDKCLNCTIKKSGIYSHRME